MPLVEGLKNEVACRDNRIRVVPIRFIAMQEAICEALTEIRSEPGPVAFKAGLLPRLKDHALVPARSLDARAHLVITLDASEPSQYLLE
jgi:hypothetical protein